MNHNQQEKVICTCSGTTIAKINQLITNGINNIDKISSATGACTGCGACDASIQELLTKHKALERNQSTKN